MRRPPLSALLALVCLTIAAGPGRGMTIATQRFVCPICGTAFEQDMVGSTTSAGSTLDGRPTGAGVWPWPLPVCPRCHFVLFDRSFSRDETETLRAFVTSPAYAALLAQEHSWHYLAAVMRERLGASDRDLREAYLAASWSARRGSDHWRTYATAALRHIDAFLASARPGDSRNKAIIGCRLIRGELLRGLGRFDEAEAYFNELGGRKEISPYRDRIALELSLIADRSSAAEQVGRTPKPQRRARALAAARQGRGWPAVIDRFDPVDADSEPGPLGSPPILTLTLTLRARTGAPITEAIVQAELPAGAPVARAAAAGAGLDWSRALASIDEAIRAVGAAPWINGWLAAGADRRVRIELDASGNQSSFFVNPDLLAHARLPAQGVHEVWLAAPDQAPDRLVIASNGTSIVVQAAPQPGSHWLDRQRVQWLPDQDPPDYITVDPQGRWERNRRAAKAAR
jgi:hypothetical protein